MQCARACKAILWIWFSNLSTSNLKRIWLLIISATISFVDNAAHRPKQKRNIDKRSRASVYGQYVLASALINFLSILDRLLQLLSESAAIESGNDVGDGADNYLEASIDIESFLDNSFSEADDLMAFTDRAKLEQTELWERNKHLSMPLWRPFINHSSCFLPLPPPLSRLQWHFVQRRWWTNFLGVRTFAGHPEKGGGQICIQNTYPGLKLQ